MLAIVFVCIAAPLRAQFVYVANEGSNNVSAYSLGAHGFLTPVPGSPFKAGIGGPLSVAVDPTGKFAYLVDHVSVLAYAIGTNGALTPIPDSPFAAGKGPNSVAVDPTGKFVYVANLFSVDISAYHIRAGGGLKPVTGSPFPTQHHVWALAVDPTGKFVYTANVHHNDLSAYSIGADGALKLVPGSPFAAGPEPKSIAVDPSGKFVYVGNSGDINFNHSSVSGYSIGADGALTPVPGSPFTNEISSPESVTVDPTGRFAYVGNLSFNSDIRAYSIGANGELTLVPGQTSQGHAPASMAVDPTGKFVCVASLELHSTLVFRIGKDGALTAVAGSPFAAGNLPNSVAVSPFVPFASSSATVDIHNDIVALSESFTLGANSNGIDPAKENVTFQIGTFSMTIPAGSFKLNPDHTYGFQGVINGVSIQVEILKVDERLSILDGVFKGVDLSGVTKPVTVVLTIGIDSGSTAAGT